MNITEDLIPKGAGIRTGKYLISLKGLVVHWIGASQPKASVIRNNFKTAECGTHYIIDWNDGSIIHCVPDNEMCYHVGANKYTALKQQICGNANPNAYLVGIECCINPNDKIYNDFYKSAKYPNLGKPSDIQYKNLVEFCACWLKKNNLTAQNLYRHYDITGKECHIWFKNHQDKWEQLKKDITAVMTTPVIVKPEQPSIEQEGISISEMNLNSFIQAAVIQSPEYWRKLKIKHLEQLFSNAINAGIDSRVNNGITDYTTAVKVLQDAKIMVDPTYWLNLIKLKEVEYLDSLIINIANRCKDVLRRIVHAEARGEDEKGQILVANVIYNRSKNGQFPNGIYNVVFQEGQFAPVANQEYQKAIPTESVKMSCDKSLSVDYSHGALYFCTSAATEKTTGWIYKAVKEGKIKFLFKHGSHNFYR